MLLNLTITVNRLNVDAVTKVDTSFLCFDFQRIIGLNSAETDPIFEQWKTDNAAYLGKLLDETPANPTTKVLNGSREWVIFPTPTIEHDQTRDKNGNPLFLHATQAQHDRWTNNYTYKIENKEVSTWAASTAYTGYGYQAQINIPNLTENDIVSVTFAGVDVISGNYYPTIQFYAGYILVFAKVNTTITIPTIEITKIEL